MSTTEVVFYQIKSGSIFEYSAISGIANQFLRERKGFVSRVVKQDHKDQTLFLDIVEWETLEDALEASEALQSEPALAPFFEAFERIISLNHFHPFGE